MQGSKLALCGWLPSSPAVQSTKGRVPFGDAIFFFSPNNSFIHPSPRQLLAVNDCWPESTKLSKGEHTVRVQVRHPDQSALKRLKSHPLTITRKLSSSLAVPVHGSMMEVSTAAKPPATLCLDK